MAHTQAHVHGVFVAGLSSSPRPSTRTVEFVTPPLRSVCENEAYKSSQAKPLARSVSCRALSPEDGAILGAVPQTPHESLLNRAATSAWEYLEAVLPSTGQSPLDSIASASSNISGLPKSVSDSITRMSDQVTAIASAKTPAEWNTALQSLSTTANTTWTSLQSSFISLNLPSLAFSDLPDLSTLANSSQSTSQIIANSPNIDFSRIMSSMALFNGTFSESEVIAIVSVAASVIALASLTATIADKPFATTASDSELPSEYDGDAIYSYWTQQPVTMLQRAVETTVMASGILAAIQLDKITGKEKQNEKKRARMVREAIDRMGPAYIKVAQALSTRVDLLPPAYYEEITLLQDQVKPFPTQEAMAIIEEELGMAPSRVFSSISSEPIAAASLGQVYRATLRSTGADVAVKVQRPGVLELVALDLVLGRRGVEIAGSLFPDLVRSADILPVLDEWAFKLYREMDYRREATVMQSFAADLSGLSGILVPESFPEATTRRVLCTQWIEGEKLSESTASDVKELCTTLLNAYLIQLLDTGLLHADPHPGNLIRTPDGKICILDYGLVTEVPEKFRVYILEYMAHLSLKDWHAVGQDFVNLQFVTPDSVHPNSVPGLMDAVGAVLEVLSLGGGAKNLEEIKDRKLIDNVGLDPSNLEEAGFMDGFATVLDNLANPDVDDSASEKDRERAAKIKLLNEQVKFQLPPYFVLILRAFSVIEGIALKADPQYSIIMESFPYLSRRLLTDNTDDVRAALREVLYGNGKRMNMERFRTLFQSLPNFTTDGLTAQVPAALPAPSAVAPGAAAPPPPSTDLDKNVVFALRSILSTNGQSYIQQLLVEELAATLESLSRGAAVTLLQRALNSSLSTATLALLERLGPLRRIVFPLPLPVEVASQFGSVVTLTDDDRLAIRNVEVVWSFLQPEVEKQMNGQQLQLSLLRSFAESVQELPRETRRELVVGAGRTSQMVVEQVMQRTVARFSKDVESARGQNGALAAILGRPAEQGEVVEALAMRSEGKRDQL